LEDNDYFVAGILIAMSLVHTGLAPHFLSPVTFQALLSDQPLAVPLQDVYDHELKSSLESLLDLDLTWSKQRDAQWKGTYQLYLTWLGLWQFQ